MYTSDEQKYYLLIKSLNEVNNDKKSLNGTEDDSIHYIGNFSLKTDGLILNK